MICTYNNYSLYPWRLSNTLFLFVVVVVELWNVHQTIWYITMAKKYLLSNTPWNWHKLIDWDFRCPNHVFSSLTVFQSGDCTFLQRAHCVTVFKCYLTTSAYTQDFREASEAYNQKRVQKLFFNSLSCLFVSFILIYNFITNTSTPEHVAA